MGKNFRSGRLALYLWAAEHADKNTITSDEIAEATGIHPTMVRRDLSDVLGRKGKRGSGYDAADLARALREVLAGHAPDLGDLAADVRLRAERLAWAAAQVRDG
jgi:NADH/NAD ratio-sensing transcriptional regulator Rex